ncbi:aluminum-activated malate transporter 1 [Euphorbia peplus]|nr:aluminum-activated malate transporter 1 [Euphorbia peplus]
MVSPNVEETKGYYLKMKALHDNIWNGLVDQVKEAKKIAKDDPRKIIHSLKVGIAITLVSLFYYFNPVYDGFGVSAIWTVLTVVVVFEYTVGATIGRGLNRMLATLIGSALGYGAHWIASHSGKIGEPILVAIFVYIFAATVTFIRFFPKMKARYDYGLLILVLTFCMISVSGYRDDEVIHMAHKRVTTIIIGCVTTLLICIFICPVWIGQDLHCSIAGNLDKLANFLQGFGSEYFETSQDNNTDKSFLQAYKSVLTSKNNEETMANLARWEPCHGRFKFRHPWKQYLKVGSLSRECAYKIDALNTYLSSNNQTADEIRSRIEEQCRTISVESGNALKELATTIKTMTSCKSKADAHISKAKEAAEILKSRFLEQTHEGPVSEIIRVASVASTLMDVIECIGRIGKCVEQLAVEAYFNTCKNLPPTYEFHRGTVQPVSDVVIVDIASVDHTNSSSGE